MAAADVAGTIRSRALARRRAGPATARRIAVLTGVAPAVEALAATPYGRYVRPGQSLAEAERAVLRTLVWHLRVLAGWQSRPTVERLRVLAGAFQVADLEEQLLRLTGGSAEPPLRLGALALGGDRVAAASGRAELRAALATSPWGDPGADSPFAVATVTRLSWLHRVARQVPVAASWAAGAALLILARDRVLDGRTVAPAAAAHLRALTGAACLTSTTLSELRGSALPQARWVLDGVAEPADLWRAEARWWARVDRDGTALLHGTPFTGTTATGCGAALAADAWRVRAALESAARGGSHTEVLDAAA